MSIINDVYHESQTKATSRQNIIMNGFDLFATMGIDAVSMKLIADHSNITIRNLYRYYPSKESLIMDVAYYYISMFNNEHTITLDLSLPGYDLLRDVLEKQIEHKILTVENQKTLAFIAYFDIYLLKADMNHEAIKNYIEAYAPLLKGNLLKSTKIALLKGVEDKTLALSKEEVDYYLGYIFHSIMSLLSRIALKRYETDIQTYNFIEKHIMIILKHLRS